MNHKAANNNLKISIITMLLGCVLNVATYFYPSYSFSVAPQIFMRRQPIQHYLDDLLERSCTADKTKITAKRNLFITSL